MQDGEHHSKGAELELALEIRSGEARRSGIESWVLVPIEFELKA